MLVGISLLVGGVFLALYGLFAILYSGDTSGSGDTYVRFGGREVDADVVGGIALVGAFIALAFAALLLKRGRDSVKP